MQCSGTMIHLKRIDKQIWYARYTTTGLDRVVSIVTRGRDNRISSIFHPASSLQKNRRASEKITVFFAEHQEARITRAGISKQKDRRKEVCKDMQDEGTLQIFYKCLGAKDV